jgi:hypothetical protein
MPGKRYEVLDAMQPGLAIRVTAGGAKTFVLRSRFATVFDLVEEPFHRSGYGWALMSGRPNMARGCNVPRTR